MNMYSYGIDPKLDFSDMPHIREVYERLTRMHVGDRQPYAGDLVFSAFSGSHQDAIAKGMNWREEKKLTTWTVPYLPIDPVDVGRTYDSDVIRINSQSGKGGISYILKQNFSISIPESVVSMNHSNIFENRSTLLTIICSKSALGAAENYAKTYGINMELYCTVKFYDGNTIIST